MITQFNWRGCNSRSKWENRIRQSLEQVANLREISKAEVTVDHLAGAGPFRLSMVLSIPGPNILASSAGQTFDEAMHKLDATVSKMLSSRRLKARRYSGAARGVKPAFRG